MARIPVTYAHLPGGGPVDRTCRECFHMVRDATNQRVCGKAAVMAGKPLEAMGKAWAGSSACKYFKERPR